MKKFFLLTGTVAILTAATGCNFRGFASWSDADLGSATNVVQTAAIPPGTHLLELDNRNGKVHITGTDDNSAHWSWKLTVRAATMAAAKHIATNTTCKAEIVGGHFALVVTAPDSRTPHSIQSDFEIALPKSAGARVQNHFGHVEITGLNANVEVANENGQVDVSDIAGAVEARTSFDGLSVSNATAATLNNQNGEIRVAAIGRSVEATTSFDSLIAADIRGSATLVNQNGNIRATTIGGALTARTSFDSLVARDIGGPATLRDQNGRIEATGIGGSLDAKTSFDSLIAHDINGPARLRNQNGSIKITKAGGDTDVETSFDSLRAEDIQGDAVLANQNGEVIASGITGSVKASTSFATLQIAGPGSKFICRNQNGAIRLRATSPSVTNIEANTSFDTLEVYLPADLKPAIQARTSFADVESDFPVLAKPRGEDPFAGIAPDVARISLDNQNGKIAIARN